MHEVSTPIRGPLVPARFVERPNRFIVRCRLEPGGDVVTAHIPDRGRLEAVLVPGRRIWVRRSTDPKRKTGWSALVAEAPGGEGLLSLDTTLPNRLVGRALGEGAFPELDGWTLERAEWSRGPSRFDFLLGGEEGRLVLEVKSVGLVEDGVAYFPDAVTARGTRHLRELAEITREDGWRAAVLFVVQRDDAVEVRPAAHIDPEFAAALLDAERAGVRLLGRRCHVGLDGVRLMEPVPVVVS